jgi:hypothetical protein
MKIDIDTMPLLPILLNGKGPYVFAVDTGYLASCVAPATGDALGLEKNEDDCLVLETLEVDALRFEAFEMYVSDNPKLWDLLGSRIAGIIGMDFLKHFEFTIDYPGCGMTLTPSASLIGRTPAPKPDVSYVRIKYPNRYVVVPVQVNDRGPYDFLLDTGAKTSVIAEDVADALGLAKGDRKAARGAVNDKTSWTSNAGSLTVGEKTVEDLRVSIMDCTHVSKSAQCAIHGYLGDNFLRHFCVTVNILDLYLGLRG